MDNRIIKICGINTQTLARYCAKLGVNLVGLVFHRLSKRFVTLKKAAALVKIIKQHGAQPVAVFVDHTADQMELICRKTDIQVIQLHGEIARAQHHLLSDKYRRIYVLNLFLNNELKTDSGFKYLIANRDMILIDHDCPGQGNIICDRDFKYSLKFPWLIAGGLNSCNVSNFIKKFNPTGVDVSSGVEINPGIKDASLIEKFVKKVRGTTCV